MGRRGFLGMLAALVVAPAVAAQGPRYADFGPGALVELHGREGVWSDWDLRAGDSLSLAG